MCAAALFYTSETNMFILTAPTQPNTRTHARAQLIDA